MVPPTRTLDFVCPKDKSPLKPAGDDLWCAHCETRFPVIRGIPILINDENSVFAISDYTDNPYGGAEYGSTHDKTPGLRGVYHSVMSRISETDIKRRHLDAETAIANIQRDNPVARLLIIGSGETTYEGDAQFVYTDVAFSKNAQSICDAHDIPFADGYFDAAILVAVMEHVIAPDRCADEVWRVLKPGGFVYAATPFLQPVHMGAYDFTRFTLLGHRRLFRKFDAIETGMALGPGPVLAWSFQYFLLSLSDNKTYRRVARAAGLILTFPLKYLDYVSRKHEGAP